MKCTTEVIISLLSIYVDRLSVYSIVTCFLMLYNKEKYLKRLHFLYLWYQFSELNRKHLSQDETHFMFCPILGMPFCLVWSIAGESSSRPVFVTPSAHWSTTSRKVRLWHIDFFLFYTWVLVRSPYGSPLRFNLLHSGIR